MLRFEIQVPCFVKASDHRNGNVMIKCFTLFNSVKYCALMIAEIHPVAAPIADEEKDDWLWEAPLAVACSAIVNRDDAAHCLKNFIEEAVKPFGSDLDLEVDRTADLLKQMLRKYKNPAFDITKHLCIEFKDEIGVDAGGLTREYFYLLMERLKQGPGIHISMTNVDMIKPKGS